MERPENQGGDMLACNRLRIDSGKGSPVLEYKIENDRVEGREFSFESGDETGWQRLTSEQISSHVMADTVLARWLRGRMGLYRLLRACGGDPFRQDDGQKSPESRLAA
jgi:hypothetical protein